ncbi:RNA polymerase sigma-70 factor [Chitinophaga polysaccharea]|uniref:RNA polymerase sigma-70 factor n=1 Tax=Chitinophaga TaxID=79328 RepID=UPI001454F044|nr:MULTISPECIES: RNA polymerase sigma-70 factor [Chitinophaga]NLR58687.1 RNA polymerase sigma-70 factor [Chitinophaga polysaccharea]NLU91215.1 RNA polymerase sigma-70 factor [Chitinophaga sp. Ak27]
MTEYIALQDEALVILLANNDNKAFETLYQRYAADLYRHAHNRFPVPHLLEDMLQDIFIALYKNRHTLGEIKNIKAYLYGALRNRIFNEIRNSLLHQQHHQHLPTDKITETANTYDVKLLEQQLEQALDKLTARSRQVFLLSRREHLSHKEIAQRLGISVKAVEKHMGKSLQVMRSEFKDYGLALALIVVMSR